MKIPTREGIRIELCTHEIDIRHTRARVSYGGKDKGTNEDEGKKDAIFSLLPSYLSLISAHTGSSVFPFFSSTFPFFFSPLLRRALQRQAARSSNARRRRRRGKDIVIDPVVTSSGPLKFNDCIGAEARMRLLGINIAGTSGDD